MKSAFPTNLESPLDGTPSNGPGLEDAIQQDARWRVLDWLAASVVATHETQVSSFCDCNGCTKWPLVHSSCYLF